MSYTKWLDTKNKTAAHLNLFFTKTSYFIYLYVYSVFRFISFCPGVAWMDDTQSTLLQRVPSACGGHQKLCGFDNADYST